VAVARRGRCPHLSAAACSVLGSALCNTMLSVVWFHAACSSCAIIICEYGRTRADIREHTPPNLRTVHVGERARGAARARASWQDCSQAQACARLGDEAVRDVAVELEHHAELRERERLVVRRVREQIGPEGLGL
jgi:hypothetical protein